MVRFTYNSNSKQKGDNVLKTIFRLITLSIAAMFVNLTQGSEGLANCNCWCNDYSAQPEPYWWQYGSSGSPGRCDADCFGKFAWGGLGCCCSDSPDLKCLDWKGNACNPKQIPPSKAHEKRIVHPSRARQPKKT